MIVVTMLDVVDKGEGGVGAGRVCKVVFYLFLIGWSSKLTFLGHFDLCKCICVS